MCVGMGEMRVFEVGSKSRGMFMHVFKFVRAFAAVCVCGFYILSRVHVCVCGFDSTGTCSDVEAMVIKN